MSHELGQVYHAASQCSVIHVTLGASRVAALSCSLLCPQYLAEKLDSHTGSEEENTNFQNTLKHFGLWFNLD